MSDDWIITLSGPLATRNALLADLAASGADIPDQDADVSHGLAADKGHGWITARHCDLNAVTAAAAPRGWSLRLHHPTPTCRGCGGSGCDHCEGRGRTNAPLPMSDPIADLQAQVEALTARLDKEGR